MSVSFKGFRHDYYLSIELEMELLFAVTATEPDNEGEDRMRLIKNVGIDRVFNQVSSSLHAQSRLDVASNGLSLLAFGALAHLLASAGPTRLLLSDPAPKSSRRVGICTNSSERAPEVEPDPLAGGLLGDDSDRERRNALQARGLAADLLQWLDQTAQVRLVPGKLPQSGVITEWESGAAIENAVAGGTSR